MGLVFIFFNTYFIYSIMYQNNVFDFQIGYTIQDSLLCYQFLSHFYGLLVAYFQDSV